MKWSVSPGDAPVKIGRPRKDASPSPAVRQQKVRTERATMRRRCIATLDFETDRFDNEKETKVFPFAACLFSDQFDPVVIWDENRKRFIAKVIAAISGLPDEFTVYAHNGGRFDFMFLVSELRGQISFKGRGIMEAKIGDHTLRDSFNIIPQALSAYRKDEFDYAKLDKKHRHKFKKEIIDYMVPDASYLFELMRHFVDQHGLKLTIGQTAMGILKTHYPEIERFTDNFDRLVRDYFFGGRVECFKGRGDFKGPYKLYDVNSMYPYVMANYKHPIGGTFDYKMRAGPIRENTIFIDLECDNRGALISRTEEKETVATMAHGNFLTTIWEFDVAIKYNLISNVKVNYCLDCEARTDFSKFIVPIYDKRLVAKEELKRLRKIGADHSEAYQMLFRDDIFNKFFMNTGYGKFAQDPRNFKEYYLTPPGEMPPPEWMASIERMREDQKIEYLQPEFESVEYWIWCKPNPGFRFNNVGTAASITGAARALLLEALQHADDPIYCDTDSIICRELNGVRIHDSELGAWDLEDEFSRVLIWAKKGYACERKSYTCEKDRFKVRSKGSAAPSWKQCLDVVAGVPVELRNFAPTLDRYGSQEYGRRTIRATAPLIGARGSNV